MAFSMCNFGDWNGLDMNSWGNCVTQTFFFDNFTITAMFVLLAIMLIFIRFGYGKAALPLGTIACVILYLLMNSPVFLVFSIMGIMMNFGLIAMVLHDFFFRQKGG